MNMNDQEKETSLSINSIDSDGSSLWLPVGPLITLPPTTPTRTIPAQPSIAQQAIQENTAIQGTPLDRTSEQSPSIKTSRNSTNAVVNSITDNSNEEFSHFSFTRETNFSAIDRERQVKDKFNGILYHVIPTYNQIAILFSTKGLYNQFVSSLNKELHSRTANKDKPCYMTHLNGQKCILSCDQSESSVVVTGPGRSLWRESTFLRMSLKLFQNFAADNVEEKCKPKTQTSTPVEVRHLPHTNVLSMSPIPLSDSLQNVNSEDINRQLNVLCEVTKTLQGEINKINGIISQLIQRMDDIPEPNFRKDNLNSNSERNSKQQSEVITLNETPVERLGISPGNKSYSKAAAANIEKHQKKAETKRKPKDVNSKKSKNSENTQSNKPADKAFNKPIKTVITQRPTASKTLIIGDSILSGISHKGLCKNIECHPYPGATVDILIDKIKIYDLKCFQNIIIYVAGNDASNITTDTDLETLEEKYEQLLYGIRDKTTESKIYLCSVCPRGDTSVKDINDMIMRQCNFHECIFIDVYNTFYDKHNQLKSHFYQPKDNIHLSPSGVRGLLGAINKHIEIVNDFQKCAVNKSSLQTDKWSHQRPFSSKWKNRHVRHNQSSSASNGERCFKCGLTNHETSHCFHKKQVQCFLCKFYGHKDSICWNQ